MRKKSKVGRQKRRPFVHELGNDDDVVLSDEDERLLDEHGEAVRFLVRLNPSLLTNQGGVDGIYDSHGEVHEDHLETRYELMLAGKLSKEEYNSDAVGRLPVKMDDGRFVANQEKLEAPEVNLKGTINPKGKKAKMEKEHRLPPSPPPSYSSDNEDNVPSCIIRSINLANQTPEERQMSQHEALASLASAIVADPEKNIHSLKILREIAQRPDVKLRKLAFLTQLTVYKDIIPGYRIRPLSEAEKSAKVSKEVKKLRTFEQMLLSQYQAYLQSLDSVINAVRKKTSKHSHNGNREMDDAAQAVSLALVAINCLAELATTATHFNFRSNVLKALVERMTDTPDSPLAEAIPKCCQALQTVFQHDESGEASLEAVKMLAEGIKTRKFRVTEKVLETFLSLRLREELPTISDASKQEKASRKRKRDEPHVSRKMKKVYKKNGELQQELKEAEAEVDKEERQKLHTETLKHVFATYFRVLKHAEDSPLLPAVLEGLAKFSHLINVDFFSDLLTILRKLSASQHEAYQTSTSDKNHHNASSSLHCVVAAFRLLSGQGEVLNVDLKDFSIALYQQLPEMVVHPSSPLSISVNLDARKDLVLLLLTGLELMLLKKKQVPIDRVAAFAKRVASLSTQLPSHGTMACLGILRSLLIKYPKLGLMLDAEGRIGTGEYKAMLDDPDLCNAFATSLYEFHTLRYHYHPYVRDMARHVASLTFSETAILPTVMPSTAMTMGPTEMYEKFGRPLFDPPLTKPSKNIASGRKKSPKAPLVSFLDGVIGVDNSNDAAEPYFGVAWSR
ncbi:hypothetical protein SeLEV6574_g04632 [Synchytrium endobioticum]|nr:hypothetical protein SeLEV6574_g04632 [Synchytrium endobioticum]